VARRAYAIGRRLKDAKAEQGSRRVLLPIREHATRPITFSSRREMDSGPWSRVEPLLGAAVSDQRIARLREVGGDGPSEVPPTSPRVRSAAPSMARCSRGTALGSGAIEEPSAPAPAAPRGRRGRTSARGRRLAVGWLVHLEEVDPTGS